MKIQLKYTVLLLCLSIATSLSYAQTCAVCGGASILDFDFGAGPNPGTALASGSTDLIYTTTPCPGDGYYTIVNSTSGCWSNNWYTMTDHTGNTNGYFMLINADPTPNTFYVQTINGLTAGTSYQFASWVVNMVVNTAISPVLPDITFKIATTSGMPLQSYTTGNIPNNGGQWQQFGFNFSTPPGVTSVVLSMSNSAVGGSGNDLALDDITFRASGPSITPSITGVTGSTAYSCGQTPVPQTLQATVSSCFTNTGYQWQISTDNGTTWSDIPGANSATYTANPATSGTYMYRLAVADASDISSVNCRILSSALTIVVSSASFTVTPANNSPVCAGQPVQLSVNTTATATYQWGGPNGFTSAMQNPTIVNTILSDSGTYTVTVTDNGCAQSASTSILFLPAPLANITAAPAQTCQGGSTVLTAGGGVSYSWSTGSNNASITLSPAITGDYAVTTTGSNSCTASQQYNLVVHPLPVIVIAPGDTQICDGKMITLVAGGANSYHWNTNVNTVSFTSTLFSNTSFSVTGTDTFGCSASDTVDITIIPSPPVNISQLNTPICNGSPVSLLATGANAYSWNTGATDSMITVYPVTSTAFSVSVTGANGCTGDTSFIVIPKKPYVITENVFNPPCPPVNIGNITLSVSGNNGDYKYLWNTGGTSAYMDSLAPGSYSVQIADSLGCDTTLTFNLAYAYVFGVTIYPQDTTVPIGVYVTLQTGITANNNPVYFWFPSNGLSCTTCAAPVAHAMSGPVVYTVSVVDEYGCTASDSMRISTINISPLFVPNVFTPNGDGNNDYFQIYGPGANNNYMPFFSIKIFDRIGELVYESSDPTFRWDGTYKGKLLLPGVYVYEITYFLDGTVAGQFCKGSITLLR